MSTYAAGWITVPGKGRRWRTAEGKYLMQRPAGSAPGVLNAIRSGWSRADAALGGWLPGGGVANPASGAVRAVSKAAIGGGVLSAMPRGTLPAPADALGLLGVPGLPAAARTLQPHLQRVVGEGKSPTIGELIKQRNVSKSAHRYLSGMGSGLLSVADLEGAVATSQGKSPPARAPERAMIDFDFLDMAKPVGPHYNPIGSEVAKGRVAVNQDTPAWVWAHEFGHAADHVNRPGSFLEEQRFERMPKRQQMATINSARLRSGPGAGVATMWSRPDNGERSVFQAGAEGALFGLASNWDMLSKEALADIHGRRIARDAGVRWDNRANMAAKGSYVLGTAGPGFIQGAAEEIASRAADQVVRVLNDAVIDPVARRIRGGDSRIERDLRKYGYDPRQYTLDGSQGGIRVRERHPIGRAVMR